MNAISPRVTKRPATERGRADHGWLQAHFTFSFAGYIDPDHMGFRSLRVINNDTLQPGGGFSTHPHADMEIFTYVIEGQLEHRDSLGHGAILTPGHLQYMTAGSGIEHSERNPSSTDATRLYQIWLHPNRRGGTPRYTNTPLAAPVATSNLDLLYSGDGREDSTPIRQDADIYFGHTVTGGSGASQAVTVPASAAMPHAWIQVISGKLSVLGETLNTADGLAIENATDGFSMGSLAPSTFLLFRLT